LARRNLSSGAKERRPQKIKTRKPKQRACDERNEEGQALRGAFESVLVRDLKPEIEAIVGKGAEGILSL